MVGYGETVVMNLSLAKNHIEFGADEMLEHCAHIIGAAGMFLQIIGLLRVMFDPRTTLQREVSDQLKSHFGDKVFNTVIPRNVRLGEAPSHGVPVVLYDVKSRGAEAYLALAREFLERNARRNSMQGSAPTV